MRALCETCEKPQPVDWRPGDLCIDCGCAVRVEARCFWCAQWGPEVKYCRKCGAASVAREHYGPARMLKHMGASVFEIPKLLTELDSGLIETYESIYGTHAAVVNRHVEAVRRLSQQLYQRHWAGQLEDELVPQLPWPEERLTAYSRDTSTFPIEQELAQLVRIRNGDFTNLSQAANLLQSADETLAAEAALQLSGWRALYSTYTEISRYQLIDLLLRSPLPAHAAPRLAALGHTPQPTYSVTGEPDTDFLILLLEENPQPLEQALDHSDPIRRAVAAAQLIRINNVAALGPTLRAAAPEQQVQLLRDIIRNKKPVPALRDDLFHILTTTLDHKVERAAAQAITLQRRRDDLLRLVEIADGDHDILHSVLRSKPEPETYAEIGYLLVETGHFTMDQWGWDEAAKPGGMPIGFVENVWGQAPPAIQCHLLCFAEKQIEAHGVERSALERFLIRQCFADASVDVIGTAWAGIHRIQMHRQVGLTVPCHLSLENVTWCWSQPEVLTAIAGLMSNPEAVRQTFVRDDFDRFLRSAEDDFFAAAAAWPDECRRVINAAPLADPYTFAVRFAALLGG